MLTSKIGRILICTYTIHRDLRPKFLKSIVSCNVILFSFKDKPEGEDEEEENENLEDEEEEEVNVREEEEPETESEEDEDDAKSKGSGKDKEEIDPRIDILEDVLIKAIRIKPDKFQRLMANPDLGVGKHTIY